MRATPPGADTGVLYAAISNAGGPDRLLAVETVASQKAEIHRTSHVDDIARMRSLETLDIPAGSKILLEPSGLHVMLTGLNQPLEIGHSVPVTFVFEVSGRVPVEARILPIDSLGVDEHQHIHSKHLH